MGSGAIRRAASNAVVSVVRHFPSTTIMRFAADTLRGLQDSGENTHLLQGTSFPLYLDKMQESCIASCSCSVCLSTELA